MLKRTAFGLMLIGIATSAFAQDRTWRNDVRPIIEAKCIECHGAQAPEYNDWELLGDSKEKTPPRLNTYPHLMSYVVWPATGAMMRRLDDGKISGKPGNMYQNLGDNDAERATNLQTIKEWLGEGAWNLNRWKERKGVPGITKEQLEKIQAKY